MIVMFNMAFYERKDCLKPTAIRQNFFEYFN